jgi:hypothetical protein
LSKLTFTVEKSSPKTGLFLNSSKNFPK